MPPPTTALLFRCCNRYRPSPTPFINSYNHFLFQNTALPQGTDLSTAGVLVGFFFF